MGEVDQAHRGARLLLAGGILLGGLAAGSLFPRADTPTEPSTAELHPRTGYQQGSGMRANELAQSDKPAMRIESPLAAPSRFDASAPGPIIPAKRVEPDRVPPALPRGYPESSASSASRGLAPSTSTARRDAFVRTHKVVDGDTLAALAERYLGDASRVADIYEANRDRLPSPDALPIGAPLRIPPRAQPSR